MLQFSHALYVYATKTMKLNVIIVLNKSDLVPAPALCAWKEYFLNLCPGSRVCSVHSYKGGDLETRKILLEQIFAVILTNELDGSIDEDHLRMNIEEVLLFRENVNLLQEGKCKVQID